MFTGIVTDIGEVIAVEPRAQGLARLTIACGYANLDVQARYDARNPQAIKRLVAAGTQLRPFSQAIMEACLKASNEVNAETSAAKKAGLPIKVALIASPVDLGVVPELFDKPQSYADFLDKEISFQHVLLKLSMARLAVNGAAARSASSASGVLVRSIVPVDSPRRNCRCAPNFLASARIALFSAPVVIRRRL